MSAQRVAMDSRDYISRLPDEILGKILSLLWTNRAACTSVLSKRWRNALAFVDNLDLHDGIGGPRGFPEFVDKTLALLSNSPPIKSFSLTLSCSSKDYRINSWIRTVLERGCLELHLEFLSLERLETKFFTSNTLVKLTICDGRYPDVRLPPGSVIFPALKALSLVSVTFEDFEMYHDFISACPVLEDLYLYYCQDQCTPTWSGAVLNPSIKRLTVFHEYPDYREAHDGGCFKTPSLLYLDYSSYVEDHYEVDLGSLIEARLDIRSWERLKNKNNECSTDDDSDDDDYSIEGVAVFGNVTGLVAGMSNVKTLHLSPDSLEVFYFCCESMPVFHNLITLSFESDKERGWQVLPLLLNNSPNLETLVIKGLVHEVTNSCGNACACIPKKKKKKKKVEEEVCCLSICQVKVLNISAYGGTCRELQQMRHFLANLKCLETVKVRVKVNRREDKGDVDNKYLRITNALLKLPKVSSNCQIHFL